MNFHIVTFKKITVFLFIYNYLGVLWSPSIKLNEQKFEYRNLKESRKRAEREASSSNVCLLKEQIANKGKWKKKYSTFEPLVVSIVIFLIV